jgi:DNA-binding NtrC family response regulator
MESEYRESGPTLELATFPRKHAWAIDVQDEGRGARARLGTSEVIVGTGRGADVVLHDGAVSGNHCALSVLGNGVAIRDLGSRNGTFVGGARVKEAWGGAGTIVTVGRSTLVFTAIEEDESDDAVSPPLKGLAGASEPMRRVAAQVRRLARHSAPVLIAGESGTGKELVARALHEEGPRRSAPFVALNVAALPRELVESEMFGHERGAFTGAVARRDGAFRDAARGSLFLDEIGELPVEAQPKLLRALDGYEVRRVGGSGPGRLPDVRVIAATHVPLEERVTAGGFRRDLFHRLEVFVIEVPPLRERKGDIAAIARQLLERMESELGRRRLTSAAIARLVVHDWPGNVRELRNVLYRASDLAVTSEALDAPHIERGFRPASSPPLRAGLSAAQAQSLLVHHKNNLSAAARAAGYPRTTFRKVLERDGVVATAPPKE